MSFAEVEEVLGDPFPASARKYNPWWSNNPSNDPRTYGWLNAGYHTANVDVAGQAVTFVRMAEE